MRITKASYTDRQSHSGPNDLYGFVRIGHHDCLIEYAGRVNNGVTAMVLVAPQGMSFQPSGEPRIKFESMNELQSGARSLILKQAA